MKCVPVLVFPLRTFLECNDSLNCHLKIRNVFANKIGRFKISGKFIDLKGKLRDTFKQYLK